MTSERRAAVAEAVAAENAAVEELYENAPCGHLSTLPDGTIVKINTTLAGVARATPRGPGRAPQARGPAHRRRPDLLRDAHRAAAEDAELGRRGVAWTWPPPMAGAFPC